MNLTYRDAVAQLYGLHKLGIKFGLDNTRTLCRLMGDPQRRFRSVHVAGTNGKGSTAAMLTSIATRAGLRCGITTSPHLLEVTERIAIGEKPISRAEFARLTGRLFERVAEHNRTHTGAPLAPTFFEALIVLAFTYFAEQKVDLAVIEVGMGGRLDSTNVIQPQLAIITSIGLDHTEFLGPTPAHIAREKAGIIKRGAAVICGVTQSDALDVIRKRAAAVKQPVYCVGENPAFTRRGDVLRVRINGQSYSVKVPLPGAHQARNAAMAVAAAHLLAESGWEIPPSAIRAGIESVRWAGRLQWVAASPPWLMDAAHNPPAMETLAAYLRSCRYRKILCVFGVMADKDYAPMLATLNPLVDTWVFTRPKLERAEEPRRIPDAVALNGRYCIRRTVGDALRLARRLAPEYDMVLVTGSIFLLAEAYRPVTRLGPSRADSLKRE